MACVRVFYIDGAMMLPPPALDPPKIADDPTAVPSRRRGRWHGLVYVAVPRSRRLVSIAANATSRPPRGLCRDAHVSASRPFGLYEHEIDPFVKKLRAALAARCCRPFRVAVDGAATLKLPSEDGARTFAALAVRPSRALEAVVDAADEALGAFGREPFFAERRFHVSVAEGDDDDDDERSRSRDGSDASSDSDSDAGSVVDVDIHSVIVKAGHRRFEIPLESPS